MKVINKFFKMISVSMVLTLLLGVSAFADAENRSHFDFVGGQEIHLAKGDTYEVNVWVADYNPQEYPTYSIYKVGSDNRKTYIESDWNVGYGKVTIHIADDEISNKIGFYFYIDKQDEWDTLNITVVDPIKSDNVETRRVATYAKMGVPDPKAKKVEKKPVVDAETQALLDQYYAAVKRREAREEAAKKAVEEASKGKTTDELLAEYYAAVERRAKRAAGNK